MHEGCLRLSRPELLGDGGRSEVLSGDHRLSRVKSNE